MRNIIIALLCPLILCGTFLPPRAEGCPGGFFGSYPRAIEIASTGPYTPGQARKLIYGGNAWLIPSPTGLRDLENLNNETLPHEEVFEALAFSLNPGRVCFTDAEGGNPWPENQVPIVACVDIREIPASAPRDSSPAPIVGDPGGSMLSEEALAGLLAFLADKDATLSGPASKKIGEELYDRPTLDLLLLDRTEPMGAKTTLYVHFNINHGVMQDDSLALTMQFEERGRSFTLDYSIPLDRNLTPEEFGAVIRRLESLFNAWLREFCAMNDLETRGVTWR